jgi:ribosomal protein L40E
MMCERCNANGYIKEMLPQNIQDRAVRLKICPECNGVNSKFEAALLSTGITVQGYFEKHQGMKGEKSVTGGEK